MPLCGEGGTQIYRRYTGEIWDEGQQIKTARRSEVKALIKKTKTDFLS